MASKAEIGVQSNLDKINALLDATAEKLERLGNSVDNLEKFQKKTKQTESALATFVKKAAAIKVGIAVAEKAIKKFTDVTNETQATLNRVNRIMGENTETAKDYADKMQRLAGIRAADFLKFQSVIYQSSLGMGQSAKNAAIMSKNIAQLSYDMAAFYGEMGKVDNYLSALQNGLTGNAKQLRNLGFALTEADLKQEALLEGLDVNIRDLNTASKSLLRYNAIIRQSANMQGAYVNSFMTLSTAQSVLDMQAKELYNSIGTLLYPILMKIIPYMIGFVKLLDQIVRAIAGVFGVELPTIDVSPATAALNEVEDEAEKTGKAIEKAFTLGIDELNVLDDSASKAGSGLGNMDITGLTSPLDYDFFENYEGSSAQKFFKNIEDNLDTIKTVVGTIGTAILGWKISEGFQNALNLLKNKEFLKNLKAKAGITLMITGFAMEFAAGYDIGKGDGSAENYLKLAAGSALGIAGSLLTFGLTPAGWVIGITAALAIAVTSISFGMKKQISEAVADEFYNGNEGAITITDLTDNFKTLIDQISEINQPLVDGGKALEDFGNKADTSATQIGYIATAIANGYESANINIPQLQTIFNTFADETKSKMLQAYDNITLALVTSLNEALDAAGIVVPEYLAKIKQLKDEASKDYDDLVTKATELQKAWESGSIPAEKYATELLEITNQMQKLTGESDPVKTAMSDVATAIDGIDWENEEARNNAFETLRTSAINAKNSIEEAYSTIENSINQIKAGGGLDADTELMLSNILKVSGEVKEAQQAELDAEIQKYADTIQTSLVNNMDKYFEKGQELYQGYNLGQKIVAKLFDTTEAEVAQQTVKEYASDYIKPIETELQSIMDEVGTNGSIWASEASAQILDKVFDYKTYFSDTGGNHTKVAYGENIEKAIKEELGKINTSLTSGDLNNVTGDIGKNVDAGMSQGIDDNVNLIEESAKSLADIAPKTVRELLQIQSPSQVFAEIGQYVDEGFANGITENSEQVENAMDTMLNTLLEKAETFCNRMRDGFNKVLSELSKSMSSLKIEDNVATFTKIPKITIKRFETGGYPTSGDLFFANENGNPELVGRVGNRTVVANNDQIFQGIYQAVSAGMANMSQQPIEVTSVAVLDGETVYRNQQKVASRKGYSMGGGAFAHV